jgi:hypothetical protein
MGQRVRARNMHPVGHTRLPRYVRAKLRHDRARPRCLCLPGHECPLPRREAATPILSALRHARSWLRFLVTCFPPLYSQLQFKLLCCQRHTVRARGPRPTVIERRALSISEAWCSGGDLNPLSGFYFPLSSIACPGNCHQRGKLWKIVEAKLLQTAASIRTVFVLVISLKPKPASIFASSSAHAAAGKCS